MANLYLSFAVAYRVPPLSGVPGNGGVCAVPGNDGGVYISARPPDHRTTKKKSITSNIFFIFLLQY